MFFIAYKSSFLFVVYSRDSNLQYTKPQYLLIYAKLLYIVLIYELNKLWIMNMSHIQLE